MKSFIVFLLTALRTTLWLLIIVVVTVRIEHIGTKLSQTTVPDWFTDMVIARANDGLSWLDVLAIVALAVIAIAEATIAFASVHFGEAVYSFWLIHDFHCFWHHRPWKRQATARRAPPVFVPIKASGSKRRKRRAKKRKNR